VNQHNTGLQPSPNNPDRANLGFSAEKLPDSPIHIFTLTSLSRPAIDSWVETAKKLMESVPSEQPMFVLIDQSAVPGITFSPYFKARVSELYAKPRGGGNYAAVVLAKSFLVQIAIFFIRTINRNNVVDTRFFFKREEGLAWLKTVVDKYQTTQAGSASTYH
jgi:hypothetical protein